MKRDGFLFVVIAFAILSAFVFYFDYSKECGSVVCIATFVSTGETSASEYKLDDSVLSKIIYPFVNPVEGVLLQPADDPTEPPLPPSDLNATPLSFSSMRLDWKDNSNTANNGEEGFILQYKLSSAPASAWADAPGANGLPPNTESFIHNNLMPSTSYDYRVLAYNIIDSSPWSNTATGITLSDAPIINSFSPNPVYNHVSTNVSILGDNLPVNFAILFKPQGQASYDPYCSFATAGCSRISSNEIRFPIQRNAIADVYDIKVVNLDNSRESQPQQLTIRNAPVPIISTLTPGTVRHNIARTITINGSNLMPEYAIFARDTLTQTTLSICNYLTGSNYNCNWVNSNTFTFVIPQGQDTGSFEYQYANVIDANTGFFQYSVNWLPLTIEPTTCLDGVDTTPCSNQQGVCQGSVARCVDGEFEVCNSATYSTHSLNYASVETGSVLCADGSDNDCDELNIATGGRDYVGSGNGAIKGDTGCPIQITNINAPSSVNTGTNFNLVCTSNPGSVSVALDGFIDSSSCALSSSSGNTATFSCVSSSTPGITQIAKCDVDSSISYRSGNALTSNVQITASSCSGYSESTSCNAAPGNICQWCLGCAGTSGTKSSGGPDRCVDAGTCSGSYQCRINQCGATCEGTSSGCSQSQSCNANSCGCIDQSPVINNINNLPSPTLLWGSNNALTVNGQYFASNAELMIDGVLCSTQCQNLVITGNSISFNIGAEAFGVGTHTVSVRNPTPSPGLNSNSLSFTLRSSPVINSISPNLIVNNVNNVINITGNDFDPLAIVTANGIVVTPLIVVVNSNLIQLPLPPGILGTLVGDFAIRVISGDGVVSSLPQNLRVNYPFSYLSTLNPSIVPVVSGSSFNVQVRLESLVEMTQEEVIISAQSIPEASVSFVGSDRCTPSAGNPNPTCNVTLDVDVGNVVEQDYNITITATSQTTNIVRRVTLILQGEVGNIAQCSNGIQDSHETCIDGGGPICAPAGLLCDFGQSCGVLNSNCVIAGSTYTAGLCYNTICSFDNDGDSVPDGPVPNNVDLCLNTPISTVVSTLNGCPVPSVSRFISPLTTDFFTVPDLSNIQDMSLAVSGAGRIQYLGQRVSVLRNATGVHQALNLDNAVTIESNLIGVDALGNPELDQTAVLTFEGLSYSEAPTPVVSSSTGYIVCPSTLCQSLSYVNGVFSMNVAGFSNYSTQNSTCGDTYCSLSETCSSCGSDCGVCTSSSASGSGSGGSGGSGGSSGGPPRGSSTLVTQCNDRIDNDGDGRIDYPADTGCTNIQDNLELFVEPLIDTDEEETGEEISLERIFEVRVVFWIVLLALIGGIVVVSTVILRDLMGRKKFNQLSKAINPTQSSTRSSPPVGI